MNICFSREIFQEFLSIQGAPRKSHLELDLTSIFENIENKFVLSENYLELLQNELKTSSNSHQYLEIFFMELADSGKSRIAIKQNQGKDNSSDEFVELAKKEAHSDTLVICKQQKKSYGNLKNFIVLYDSLDTHRFFDLCYFRFKAAAKGTIAFTSHDFNNEAEVESIISNFLSINHNNITVFSRDLEIYKNKSFCSLPKKTCSVKFYTRGFATSFQKDLTRENIISTEELKSHKKALINCFGSNFKFFITNKTNMIHERRIIVDNWVLTVDDDFNNLVPKRPTWTVTINYSERLVSQILSKVSYFRQFM